MLKRAFERVLASLDLLWPFPLGIAFGVLVVGASAGAWLLFREPPAPRQAPRPMSSPPVAKSPAPVEVEPPPSEPAPPEPAVPAQQQPVELTRKSSASEPAKPAASRPLTAEEAKLRDTLTRARWYMKQGQYRPAIQEFQAALEMDPSNRDALAGLQQARGAGREPARSPQPIRATASRPPATQEAKLRDTMTRARWYMKQGQYRVAIEEFEAALAMDPSNREAQTGLEQARGASGIHEPAPQR